MGHLEVILRPSYIWDARFLKFKQMPVSNLGHDRQSFRMKAFMIFAIHMT